MVTVAFLAYHEDVCSDGPVRKQQCLSNKNADLFTEKKAAMRGTGQGHRTLPMGTEGPASQTAPLAYLPQPPVDSHKRPQCWSWQPQR